MKKHEVIVLGGGPAGSTMGAYLAKAGVDVAVVERESYPRFHIGESLLPFSMDVFRETGVFETLDSGKYIRKWGAQFIHFEEEGEVYFDFASGLDCEHPMAFEVPRADFDKDLLDHAAKVGATVYQPELVKDVGSSAEGVVVTTNRDAYEARFVVDATGRGAFFGKRLKLRRPNTDLNNVGVFAHFVNVGRLDGKREGDITIGLLPELKWCWMIPFVGERMSIGVVCSSKALQVRGGIDDYIEESLASCPALAERMKHAERVTEAGMISNYSHTCETFVGDRWILIGDAAAFLDPIFSSGVHVGVTMAKYASEEIVGALADGGKLTDNGRKERYETRVRTGVHRFHRLIRLFYDTNFVRQMKKAFTLKHTRQAFTSLVAGDVWNEENVVFRTGVLPE